MAALAVVLVVMRRDARTGAPGSNAPPDVAHGSPVGGAAPSPPALRSPAPAAGPAPARAAPEDPERELRATLRARLEASLAERLPEHALSPSELDAATDALLRLRRARLELRALPRTPEHAARLRALRTEIGQASADFEAVVELDPIGFTERVAEDEG